MFSLIKLLVALSLLLGAVTADCWYEAGAPYVQLATIIAASNPPISSIFNVPLFKPDCSKFVLADPTPADGIWAPATGVGFKFNVEEFVDEGGYTNTQGLSAVYETFSLCAEGFNEQTLFADFLVCQVTLESGQVITLGGGKGSSAVMFDDGSSLAISSYRCFLDVHHDGVPTALNVAWTGLEPSCP